MFAPATLTLPQENVVSSFRKKFADAHALMITMLDDDRTFQQSTSALVSAGI